MSAGVPPQHVDWIISHEQKMVFRPLCTEVFDVLEMSAKPTRATDFSLLTHLSTAERVQLQQMREKLQTAMVNATIRSNMSDTPSYYTSLIENYLALLPASTGLGLSYGWHDHPNNQSAEMERIYLTYNLGILPLIYVRENSTSQQKKELWTRALSVWVHLKAHIADIQSKIPTPDPLDAQKLESIASTVNMIHEATVILLAHQQIEERMEKLASMNFTPYQEDSLLSTCYHNLSRMWADLKKPDNAQIMAKSIFDYFTQRLKMACRAMAEYHAARCVLRNPQAGLTQYYPSFANQVTIYRGILLSRLECHLKMLKTTVTAPSMVDSMTKSVFGSRQLANIMDTPYGGVVISVHNAVRPVMECLQQLVDLIRPYNQTISHDPIPDSPHSSTFDSSIFRGETKDLGVYAFIKSIEPFTYTIPPPAPTVQPTESKREPSILGSIANLVTRMAPGSQQALQQEIKTYLGTLTFETNSSASSEWNILKLDLLDAMRIRKQHQSSMPPELAQWCNTQETMLLYCLEELPRMPTPLFQAIGATIREEILPFYAHHVNTLSQSMPVIQGTI